MLTKKKKQIVIKDVKVHTTDTGSSEVQAAILSKEIDELSKHLKKHPKDNHSRRVLLVIVAKIQATLKYLEKSSPKRHKTLVKKLGLK